MSVTSLSEQSCTACTPGSKALTAVERERWLRQLPGWSVVKSGQIDQLSKTFLFPNFISAMAFANRVGDLAEAANHHPAITVEWGQTTVTWWTHTISGLHLNDFILAARTDVTYSAG